MFITDIIMKCTPDSLWLKYLYRKTLNKPLNLKNPRTFNEKLQWLKLHDRNPLYTQLVDKYEVRDYIKEKIGEEYLIPLVGGPWNSFDEIDFSKLPDKFALKCTHDSGSVIVCTDKNDFDMDAARKKLTRALKGNFYYGGREWPYKNVQPRIIAEQYMEDGNSDELIDYKFYCFDGVFKFLYVSQGLQNHKTARISFLTPDWELAEFRRMDYRPFDDVPSKPSQFENMKRLVNVLSEGFHFIRVDLYEINGRIYFSELTFSPCSGFMPFEPEEWDKKVGDWLILP